MQIFVRKNNVSDLLSKQDKYFIVHSEKHM
jgi:hypothetical protein